jgi:TP53 regulating kinase-like protein
MSKSLGEAPLPKLIYRGAEAEIYLQEWYGELAIRKNRTPKPYRVVELDSTIRRGRTLHETNLMHEARRIGIPVPVIQHLDPEESSFIMEYVKGPTLKDELHVVSPQIRRRRCTELGRVVAKMHEGGLVHGDLTISNVLSDNGKLFLIDFGLGDFSNELEDRGVDLLLLNRAMKSTHVKFHEEIFTAFLKGYSMIVGRKRMAEILNKVHEIERRGRYFERA